jgi:hypothetical protein
VAFTTLQGGRFALDVLRGERSLIGTPIDPAPVRADVGVSPIVPDTLIVDGYLADQESGLPAVGALRGRAYAPQMSLEAIGQPYVSSGGGPFGTFVRAGGSMLFGDMLGDRKLAAALQVGNHLHDFALEARFLNRSRRWNWGAVIEAQPSIYRIQRRQMIDHDGEAALLRENEYFQNSVFRVAGLLAYPFDRSRRVELTAGVRYGEYSITERARVSSLLTGRTLADSRTEGSGGPPSTTAEVTAALVGDTAVWGPTAPILGTRYRFEVGPSAGDLMYGWLLLDYRRYLMPVKPYTVAMRVLHNGRYGPDAGDSRLTPTFLGSRSYVRGQSARLQPCPSTDVVACATSDALLGTRVLVGNLEVRFPLRGLRSGEIRYGPVPIDGFVFADAGLSWSRREAIEPGLLRRQSVSTIGAGSRVNLFGWPVEFIVAHAIHGPFRGWSYDVSFRPGF